jgi:hypothetical protein
MKPAQTKSATLPAPDPLLPGKYCADRVEVERNLQVVPALTVRAWIDHLRAHGWADKDIEPAWIVRARQGVTRWDDADLRRGALLATAGRPVAEVSGSATEHDILR